ncbi:DUF1707 SHOCT-like domain-containing protein [Stackebrandtia nassauensis]|uniref:DUF1707 domain-containing protein n=1 Tax=Stackebrandtia nassauensis (strain DSM 44728 / CIP 108903 / NRRL B-16338 / NBRC 102104 / LLR-40K-21) TaxID=446470 RepID=D3Q5K6_STANL|nr:DUF1707 domain-containing protein [Stackebrandtia nassauensis]ADD46066.1 protein of unknown function DUF1707 [Stackebrandtia nassauensis DSM 44728]
MSGDLERAELRISNADRERTIEHLQNCTSEGRLTLDEFTERVDAVYEAKTYGELKPLLSDLPVAGDVTTPVGASDLDDISPTGSALRRTGRWLVPRRITLRPKGSSVLLNFAHAALGHREVEIVLAAKASSIVLVLPRNAWADGRVDTKYSSFANRAQNPGDEAAVRFHVHGELHSSSLRIRRVRRFLWWEF